MEFIGNHPVLDFHNTLAWPSPDGVNERLYDSQDLVDWSRKAGVLTESEATALSRRAKRNTAENRSVVADARRLRKTLHDALFPLAHGHRLERRNLASLNDELRRASSSLQLADSRGRIKLTSEGGGVSTIVHRLAWSAAQLLTSDDLMRLSCCANPRCGWLFLDESRNHSRRWCSMEDCGSRAKSKRYYRRSKSRAKKKSARI
jgi:predicted RNA-binding Zn ribbon-like protein